MVIQRKILTKIKDHLEEKYGLDMNGGDVRSAFALYTAYQNDVIAVTELRKLVQDAFDVFSNQEPKDVTIVAYQRSVYRALEIVDGTGVSRAKVFERLLNEVSQ